MLKERTLLRCGGGDLIFLTDREKSTLHFFEQRKKWRDVRCISLLNSKDTQSHLRFCKNERSKRSKNNENGITVSKIQKKMYKKIHQNCLIRDFGEKLDQL